MKKTLSFLLALAMLFSLLAVGASAANTVLSTQKLTCEGKNVECEKYNIDGSNYFKLRDIAYLLNGTVSQFSVGWDSEAGVVSIVTGEAYEPNGGELDLSAGDQSATAVPSSQTVKINGTERTDLSVYNIGGSNFFKLRELGGTLGFFVDYDKETNTAAIKSLADVENPDEWRMSGETVAARGFVMEVANSYDENGRMIKSVISDSVGLYNTETTVTYDADGRLLSQESVGTVGGRYDFAYDADGRTISQTFTSADGGTSYGTKYTYDENGNVLTEERESVSARSPDSSDSFLITNTYDENGNLTKTVAEGGDPYTIEYTYDADGNALSETYAGKDYSYEAEYTYDADGNMLSEIYTWSDYSSKTEYTYDADGNLLSVSTEAHDADGDHSYHDEYAYNADGDLISWNGDDGKSEYTYSAPGIISSCVSYDADGAELYRAEFDADGNVLHERSEQEDTENFYCYDALGNLLSSSEEAVYGSVVTLYSRDYAAGTYSAYAALDLDLASVLSMIAAGRFGF
jgi:YD repeat-containing protein